MMRQRCEQWSEHLHGILQETIPEQHVKIAVALNEYLHVWMKAREEGAPEELA